MLRAIGKCLGSRSVRRTDTSPSAATEKSPLFASTGIGLYTSEKPLTYRRPQEEVAADIIELLYSDFNVATTQKLEDVVHSAGWWDKAIAEKVFEALKSALSSGKAMSKILHDAHDKAIEKVLKMKEFAEEHPILVGAFLAVVVIGVLYLIWPDIIFALGFGEEGPILGSFAARWQSLYPNVPKRFIFAFLQRLGMKLKPGALAKL